MRVVPPGSDELEQAPPFFGESGVSIQATWYNAGKRVIALDLASEGFRELLTEADLLIEDWRGDEAPFDTEALRDAFPQLVRLSVTPMGREGPWAGLAVNDLVATALCGAASVTGTPETPPLTGYGNQTAHTIGFYAACCALAGVRLRDANGHGSHIDLSGHETLIANTEQMLMQWFFPDGGRWTTPIAQRQGSLHWSGGYEVYPGPGWERPDGDALAGADADTDPVAGGDGRRRRPPGPRALSRPDRAREGDAARDVDAARLDGGERGG